LNCSKGEKIKDAVGQLEGVKALGLENMAIFVRVQEEKHVLLIEKEKEVAMFTIILHCHHSINTFPLFIREAFHKVLIIVLTQIGKLDVLIYLWLQLEIFKKNLEQNPFGTFLCWFFITSSLEYALSSSSINLNTAPEKSCWVKKCEGGVLYVKVDGSFIACPTNGGITTVGSLLSNGVVNCPSYSLICRNVSGFANSNNLLNQTGTPASPVYFPPPEKNPLNDCNLAI
jgi:hypothetical protein